MHTSITLMSVLEYFQDEWSPQHPRAPAYLHCDLNRAQVATLLSFSSSSSSSSSSHHLLYMYSLRLIRISLANWLILAGSNTKPTFLLKSEWGCGEHGACVLTMCVVCITSYHCTERADTSCKESRCLTSWRKQRHALLGQCSLVLFVLCVILCCLHLLLTRCRWIWMRCQQRWE